MNPRTDGRNRAALTLIGLLLLTAGALGTARSFAVFGRARADNPLLTQAERDYAHHNQGWFWTAVAALAVIFALLGLRWLAAQIGSDRAGNINLEPDPARGITTLHPGAVTDAVSDEIDSYRGVERAAARLLGDPRHPELVLTVTLNDRADLAAVRRRIEEHAIPNVRQALGHGGLPVQLDVRLSPQRRRTVR